MVLIVGTTVVIIQGIESHIIYLCNPIIDQDKKFKRKISIQKTKNAVFLFEETIYRRTSR
jgi:hypothetical protein